MLPTNRLFLFLLIASASPALAHGTDDVKLIGAFSSRISAEKAVAQLRHQPGFCDLPQIVDFDDDDGDQGFHIDQYSIDEVNWSEGYGII